VRVPCAICKNRLTSAHLGLDHAMSDDPTPSPHVRVFYALWIKYGESFLQIPLPLNALFTVRG